MYWKVFCLFTKLPSMSTIKWGRKFQNRASKIQLANAIEGTMTIYFKKKKEENLTGSYYRQALLEGEGYTLPVSTELTDSEGKWATQELGCQAQPQGSANISRQQFRVKSQGERLQQGPHQRAPQGTGMRCVRNDDTLRKCHPHGSGFRQHWKESEKRLERKAEAEPHPHAKPWKLCAIFPICLVWSHSR